MSQVTKNNGPDFDWHKSELTGKTVIDYNYRTTQNVRRFFLRNLGKPVTISRDFMQWIRANTGKTLNDAAEELRRSHEEKGPA